ncbi:MAG TPA: hypothetical protein VKW08_19980 [Xanthobacteraceae bacterium]|jgi:hypothetical protein|nr:hypothetical protein [Xanthobacteraceae bacterium]
MKLRRLPVRWSSDELRRQRERAALLVREAFPELEGTDLEYRVDDVVTEAEMSGTTIDEAIVQTLIDEAELRRAQGRSIH